MAIAATLVLVGWSFPGSRAIAASLRMTSFV
jgi:hypothetical protein